MGNICAACGHENEEGKKFCGECGVKLEQTEAVCAACGHVNVAGIKFCGECGHPLGEPLPPPVITLDRESYEEGDEICVSYTGITDTMQQARAFISIYKAEASHGEYGDYQYPNSGEGDLIFKAPIDAGDYEMRLYSRDGQYDDTTLVMKAPFNVVAGSDEAVDIQIDEETLEPDQKFTVTIWGISPGMAAARAFAAIYKVGAAHDDWVSYEYPKEVESQHEFTAPAETGEYEIRVYRRDGQYDDSTFIKSARFIVAVPAEAEIVCPACGYSNPAGTKFCNDCGVKLETAQNCPACGAELTPGLKFCTECGEKL